MHNWQIILTLKHDNHAVMSKKLYTPIEKKGRNEYKEWEMWSRGRG